MYCRRAHQREWGRLAALAREKMIGSGQDFDCEWQKVEAVESREEEEARAAEEKRPPAEWGRRARRGGRTRQQGSHEGVGMGISEADSGPCQPAIFIKVNADCNAPVGVHGNEIGFFQRFFRACRTRTHAHKRTKRKEKIAKLMGTARGRWLSADRPPSASPRPSQLFQRGAANGRASDFFLLFPSFHRVPWPPPPALFSASPWPHAPRFGAFDWQGRTSVQCRLITSDASLSLCCRRMHHRRDVLKGKCSYQHLYG